MPRSEADSQCAAATPIRRSLYVPADLPAAERYTCACEAALIEMRSPAVLAGPSAAAAWGLPLLDVPDRVFVRGATPSGARRRVHVLLGDAPVHHVGHLPVTPPALTVVDCARLLSRRDGLIVADAALHAGLCTVADLQDCLREVGPVKGIGRARWVVSEADPLAESPGESWTRMVLRDLGYDPVSQYRVEAAGFLAYVDLMLEDRLGIEFDGATKYSGAHKVMGEKLRQGQAEELGIMLMRVVWSQLPEPERLDRRIRTYGMHPRRSDHRFEGPGNS